MPKKITVNIGKEIREINLTDDQASRAETAIAAAYGFRETVFSLFSL